MEHWKPVVGYEGIYEVSQLGRVRRIAPRKHRWGGLIDSGVMLILRPELIKGYPRVNLYRNGKAKHKQVHCLVAAAFIGPCPSGKEINHKDGKRANASIENLEYVTRGENELHSYRVLGNKKNQGSHHGMHKLQEPDVLAIRALRKAGWKLANIASEFGVCEASISLMCTGKTWRHLESKPLR